MERQERAGVDRHVRVLMFGRHASGEAMVLPCLLVAALLPSAMSRTIGVITVFSVIASQTDSTCCDAIQVRTVAIAACTLLLCADNGAHPHMLWSVGLTDSITA